MHKLRILFYGDDRVVSQGSYGVSALTKFVTDGLKTVADIQITFVHRHQNLVSNKTVQGANKLAWQLLESFDELWIFGDKQANFAGVDVKTAEPYNELDHYELAVLLEWMKCRGLMFTGDHSEIHPPIDNFCGMDHRKFITLGAAIGRYIPRAHQLRVWDGPPTSCAGPLFDNQNTLEGDPASLDGDENLQRDVRPQRLVRPSTAHKLFSWVNPAGEVVPMTVFPDHQHEGEILAPKAAELDHDWPIGAPPPVVVAWGNDKRPIAGGREYKLVVAFDGEPVNVGRIVADSSFHHYIDLNLKNIDGRDCDGNPKPGTDLDQIAQYYCNLALWLAPKATRDQIKIDLLLRLATHPLVVGVRGMEVERLGKAARVAAEVEVGLANLYRTLGLSNKDDGDVKDLISTAFAGASSAVTRKPTGLPTTETVLGSIVKEFHDHFLARGIISPSRDETVPAAAIVEKGFLQAFR